MAVEHRMQNGRDHIWEHIGPSGERITVFFSPGSGSFLISTGDERINRAIAVRTGLIAPAISALQSLEVLVDVDM